MDLDLKESVQWFFIAIGLAILGLFFFLTDGPNNVIRYQDKENKVVNVYCRNHITNIAVVLESENDKIFTVSKWKRIFYEYPKDLCKYTILDTYYD